MSDLQQLHLDAPYCSKRGVRYRYLSPTLVDQVVATAARRIGPDATMIEFSRVEQRTGVESMVLFVTKDPVESEEALSDPSLKWVPFDPEGGLLNGKDWSLLGKIYSRENAVSDAEVTAIMGKARTVSAD